MEKIRLILISVCFLGLSSVFGQNDSLKRYIELLRNFAENYKPTYIIDSDTMIVSRFTPPSDSVNNFLLQCVKTKNFLPLKYCVLILRKQNREYNSVNKSDYPLDNKNYENLGYLELIRVFLNFNKDTESYLGMTYTGELCRLLQLNKDKIDDYNYIICRESKEMKRKKRTK